MEITKFVPMNDDDFNKSIHYVNDYRDHLVSLRAIFNARRQKDLIKKIDSKIEELNQFLDEYLIFPKDDYDN